MDMWVYSNQLICHDFVDAAGYMEMVNSANQNIGGDAVYSQSDIENTRNHVDPYKYPDNSWSDFLFKTEWYQVIL